MKREEFRKWLKETVDTFIEDEGGCVNDPYFDCGDLWRDLDTTGELDSMGIPYVMDDRSKRIYFGVTTDDGKGVMACQFEYGQYGQTIWPNPTCHMLWGPELIDDVQKSVDEIRQEADELENLISYELVIEDGLPYCGGCFNARKMGGHVSDDADVIVKRVALSEGTEHKCFGCSEGENLTDAYVKWSGD